jgi:hypothetical protein
VPWLDVLAEYDLQLGCKAGIILDLGSDGLVEGLEELCDRELVGRHVAQGVSGLGCLGKCLLAEYGQT